MQLFTQEIHTMHTILSFSYSLKKSSRNKPTHCVSLIDLKKPAYSTRRAATARAGIACSLNDEV
jgi:hypothetical protein